MKASGKTKGVDRRQLLMLALGTTITSISLGSSAGLVMADASAGQKAIEAILKGRKAESGGILLDVPQIAENGNTVPVSFIVESPMTNDSFVKAVHIIAEDNPSPHIASFYFTPSSGRATSYTRMRLAKTQNVSAIAEMSDGSLRKVTAEVKVTVGGCAPAK